MASATDKNILWQVCYKAVVGLVAAGVATPQTSDIAAEIAAMTDQFYAHASVQREAATTGTQAPVVAAPQTAPVAPVATVGVVPNEPQPVMPLPQPTPRQQPVSAQQASTAPGNTDDLASAAQRKFAMQLLGWNNKTLADYGVESEDTMSWRAAKQIIEALKKQT